MVGWSTRPGSHKLGAKWVEVRNGGDSGEGYSKMKADLKRGQQHPLKASLELEDYFASWN
jgi:hypothetical protein